MTNVPAARRVAAVSLLLPAAIVGSTLSLGLRWSVGSDQAGYQLGIRIFLVAAIVLLGFALYLRESAPGEPSRSCSSLRSRWARRWRSPCGCSPHRGW